MKILHVLCLSVSATSLAASSPVTLGSHEGTTRVTISPDGTTAASTGDKTVKLWNVAAANELRAFPLEEAGLSLAFAPDNQSIAVRMESGVEVLDLKSGRRLQRFDSHTGGVPRIAISPDGKWLASGGSDHKARVWELATARLAYELPHQYHLVFGVHFSPDSTRLITGAGDGVATHGEVKMWDMSAGKNVWRHEGKQIWMVAAMPDSAAAGSIDVEGTVVFHDWAMGTATRKLLAGDQCRALAVSADGRTLAASARNSIKVWQIPSDKPVTTLDGHTNWVISLAFTPDGSTLVSGSSDRTVRLWSLPGEPKAQ